MERKPNRAERRRAAREERERLASEQQGLPRAMPTQEEPTMGGEAVRRELPQESSITETTQIGLRDCWLLAIRNFIWPRLPHPIQTAYLWLKLKPWVIPLSFSAGGVSSISVKEFAVADLLFFVAGLSLIVFPLGWQGVPGHPGLTRLYKGVIISLGVALIPFMLAWVHRQKGEEPWSIFLKKHAPATARSTTHPGTGLQNAEVKTGDGPSLRNALRLGTELISTPYGDGTVFGGIKWQSNYVDVRLIVTNAANVSLDNIDMRVQLDTSLAAVSQLTTIPGVSIDSDQGPVIPLTLEGVDPAGKPVALPFAPTGLQISPIYRIFCKQLPANRYIHLTLASVAMYPTTGRGASLRLPDKMFAAKRNPKFIRVTGHYETSSVDGSRRYPLDWTEEYKEPPASSAVKGQSASSQFRSVPSTDQARVEITNISINRAALPYPVITFSYENRGKTPTLGFAKDVRVISADRALTDQEQLDNQAKVLANINFDTLPESITGNQIYPSDSLRRFFTVPDRSGRPIDKAIGEMLHRTLDDVLAGRRWLYLFVAIKYRDHLMADHALGVTEMCAVFTGRFDAWHDCGRHRAFLQPRAVDKK